MSASEILETIRGMPPAERRNVVGKIWAEFSETELELSPRQAAELDRRLQEHTARPEDVVPWSEIRAATEAKYARKP
ncbi:MAG: putative addiction module component [Verrucomicrobiota bacterium]|jgi:putative addiction module component (TIGR02574 family)